MKSHYVPCGTNDGPTTFSPWTTRPVLRGVGLYQDWEFTVRFALTGVSVRKAIWAASRAEALAELRSLRDAFAGGRAAFEIIVEEEIK